jgi:hypothetical protein
MLTEEHAQRFANDWIDAWNTHDLDRVMTHYDESIEYYSVFLSKLTNHKAGVLTGKENVKEYLAKGLQAYPELNFELERVFIGVASLTLQYQSVNGLIAAEVFELNGKGLVSRVQCHYSKN